MLESSKGFVLKRLIIRYWIIIFIFSLLIIVLITAFFLPISDEEAWIKAGGVFLDALIKFQPSQTYNPEVSHRLGVTVLWVSAGIYALFGSLQSDYLIIIHRFFFLTLNLLLFFYALKILYRFVGLKVLGLLTLYMFLSRFFPIIGRSTWLDQFLTMFGFLMVIFWLQFLFGRQRSKLLKAGFFNGLLLLTKYAGFLFTPIIFGLSILYSYRTKTNFKKLLLPLIILTIFSLVLFVILYPAVWVDPYKALFLRLEDNNTLIRKTGDIWEYLREIKYLDPVLIIGSVFVILDWRREEKGLIHFLGLAGLLYIIFYLLIFLILIAVGRLDYPFLAGIYRYTFPAIPIMALYTFYRCEFFIKNKELQFGLVLFLFVREIIFLPFLVFK